MSDQETETESDEYLHPTKDKPFSLADHTPQQYNSSSIQKFRQIINQFGVRNTRALVSNEFDIDTFSYSPPPLEEEPVLIKRRPWQSGDDLPSLNEFYSTVKETKDDPHPDPDPDPKIDAVHRALAWSLEQTKGSVVSTAEPVSEDNSDSKWESYEEDPWDYKETRLLDESYVWRDPWDYNETRQQITESFARYDDRNMIISPRTQFLKDLCGNVVTQIGFLQAIVDYHEVYEVYPCENAGTLREFRENWIQLDFSDIEVSEHILMLQKKFSSISERAYGSLGRLGEDERRFFCLGHRIWGNDVQVYDSDDEQMEKVKNAATRPETDMKKKLKIGGS